MMRFLALLLPLAAVVLVLLMAENVQAKELNRFEGQFAPDPEQDEETLMEAVLESAEDPFQFQQTLQNHSWVEYTHSFELPQGARSLKVVITIDYALINGSWSEGPAGTLDLTFRTPDGDGICRDEREPSCYEIVHWTGGDKEISHALLLPTVEGEWTITISGSGLEGAGSQIYSGNYELSVQAELNTPTDSGGLPAPSLVASVAAVAVIALRRRY